MQAAPTSFQSISRFFGAFRWGFMPLGLFALVAVGVHCAADFADDNLLRAVEWLDAWLDGLLAQSEATLSLVNRIDSRERTLISRSLALCWELSVDFFIALPSLGYSEVDRGTRKFAFKQDGWRQRLARLNRQPTPMRLVRPCVTAIFACGGAYAVSRLVESTLFLGLLGDVAPASVAAPLARIAGAASMALVLFSLGWRATLRALEHADAACQAAKHPWSAGWWGSLLALPLALALLLQGQALLSFFR